MELSKIAEMLTEYCDTPAEEITAETKFADLGIDSLDIAEIAMSIEDEMGITIEMDQSLATVGDILAKINSQK